MEKKKVEQEDIAIGGTFDIKGKNICHELPFGCIAPSRKDHTNVIFVEA